jgi:VWFA-related protein
MPKVGVVSLVFLAATALIPGLAQDVTPPPAGPTIRVTATEIALDLVVRDKKGRQVKNVKQGEVEIYENGVRQQLLSFRMVPGREQQSREESQAKPQATTGAFVPLRELNTVCIVFHNIDPVTQPHAIEIVKEFIKTNLPPESYIGIFNLNEKLIPVHEFTKDRQELLASSFNGNAMDFSRASAALLTASPNIVTVNAQVDAATHSANVSVDTTGGEISKTAIVGADVSNSTGANRVRGDQVQERSEFGHIMGMHEQDRVTAMINAIGTLPGRKTVLMVTTGLSLTGDPDMFQKILTNANSHGITVYALDSTEMSPTGDTVQAGNNALGQMASQSRQQTNRAASAAVMQQNSRQGDDMMAAVRTSDTQSSLRALSEGTGGFLIANTNDFRKSFQQLVQNLDAHYEAVYRPTSAKYDGRLRKVEVKLARSDLQVESRTGYFAMPDLKGSGPLTPLESTAMAVLAAEPRPHSFDFRVTAYHFQKDRANPSATLAFELPSAKLGATVDPARKIHKFEVSLLALVRDASGEVVDKYSLNQPYYIPEANVAAVRADALTYTHVLDLPPGRYTVDAAVVDREGAQASAQTGSFEIPEPPKGIAISSLAMVQHLDPAGAKPDTADPFTFKDKHVIPMAQATVSPATKSWVYFVVYRNKSNPEKPKIRVEFKNGGQVFAEQTVALPEPDERGAIAMLVAAAATRPGNCELRITAIQGNDSATEHIAYLASAQ